VQQEPVRVIQAPITELEVQEAVLAEQDRVVHRGLVVQAQVRAQGRVDRVALIIPVQQDQALRVRVDKVEQQTTTRASKNLAVFKSNGKETARSLFYFDFFVAFFFFAFFLGAAGAVCFFNFCSVTSFD
jgi:hypothetical protein